MTTSRPAEAFVWVWLPGAEEPVLAGRLDENAGEVSFLYARRYRERPDAISLFPPELPLVAGRIMPLRDLSAPGCILDARPDSWGQQVIMNSLLGRAAQDSDPASLGVLTYLLNSSSDRIGALDFQTSADEYVPRGVEVASLEDLGRAAELVEQRVPLPPELHAALLRGTSIGGARPKASLRDSAGTSWIAKFSSTTDVDNLVKFEYVAMRLAQLAGLDVARVDLTSALGKSVLLVERFDREAGTGARKSMVSALTMLGLDERDARWASYFELAQVIRRDFADAVSDLEELFARITFNILVGNTDDHARNHAAFWDGRSLRLTPAYDICPYLRFGGEATQAMIIGDDRDSWKFSQVAGCVARSSLYQVAKKRAREIVDRQIDTIESSWDEVCDEAELTPGERQTLRERAVLLPYALEGYSAAG